MRQKDNRFELRLSQEERRKVAELARLMGVPQAEAIRQSIRLMADVAQRWDTEPAAAVK